MRETLSNIEGAYLNSFGVVNQFLELTFWSENFEEIAFFLDCEITTSDIELNLRREFFDSIDKDVSMIVSFVKFNRKKVESANYINNSLILKFDNNVDLIFNIRPDFGESLSITFKKNKSDEKCIMNIDLGDL